MNGIPFGATSGSGTLIVGSQHFPLTNLRFKSDSKGDGYPTGTIDVTTAVMRPFLIQMVKLS
jgi:hypothetical protein